MYKFFCFLLFILLSGISYGRSDIHYQENKKVKTLMFSNLLWYVRNNVGGPGPNNFSDTNAWVDANGYLHLKLTFVNGKWYCPEVYTDKRLGFGQYWYYTVGPLQFDQNIILGLFHYTTPDIGPDGTNEIDIEFSRWGIPGYPPGGYTVWPAVAGPSFTTKKFDFTQAGQNTTHGYTWTADKIFFQSGNGHDINYSSPIYSWTFAPADFQRLIPQKAMPVHLNIWLLDGKPPTDGKELEIILTRFCYKPVSGSGNCDCNPGISNEFCQTSS